MVQIPNQSKEGASNTLHVIIQGSMSDFVLKKAQIDLRSDEEKICHEFMNDCIQKSDGREKCVDVYNRFSDWIATKDIEILITRQKIFSEIKKMDPNIIYKKTVKFENSNPTYGFIGMSLI